MTVIQLTGLLVIIASSVVTDLPSVDKTKLTWSKHYAVAKETAQSNERPLVVVLENPTNNTEKIDESKLREQDRATLTKEKFELVRVDVNTDYGKKVAAAFGATRFPYTAVTDKRSVRIVFRKAGQMSENDWSFALAKSSSLENKQLRVQSVTAATSTSTVQWKTSYENTLVHASQDGRPVLLYLTAPGCTYCEILKREALTQRWLVDDINTNFNPVQVNGRERKDISDRFQVRMFPTLVVMSPAGEVLNMWSGFNGTDDFANRLASAKSRFRVVRR